MGDSKRQKIVSAVVTRLKLINGSGGYTTDVNNHVEDSRTNWDENELPAISVFDGEAEAAPTSAGQTLGTIHTMPVIIRGFLVQGSTASAARTLLKDIQRAIRVDDKWTVSNVKLVMQTRQQTDRILRNEESFEVEAAEQVIEVQFQTAKFNAEE